MKNWKNWVFTAIFAVAGGLLGYGYYHFFGCTNGCPISASPWMTTAYFAVMGLLLSVVFRPAPKKETAKIRNN